MKKIEKMILNNIDSNINKEFDYKKIRNNLNLDKDTYTIKEGRKRRKIIIALSSVLFASLIVSISFIIRGLNEDEIKLNRFGFYVTEGFEDQNDLPKITDFTVFPNTYYEDEIYSQEGYRNFVTNYNNFAGKYAQYFKENNEKDNLIVSPIETYEALLKLSQMTTKGYEDLDIATNVTREEIDNYSFPFFLSNQAIYFSEYVMIPNEVWRASEDDITLWMSKKFKFNEEGKPYAEGCRLYRSDFNSITLLEADINKSLKTNSIKINMGDSLFINNLFHVDDDWEYSFNVVETNLNFYNYDGTKSSKRFIVSNKNDSFVKGYDTFVLFTIKTVHNYYLRFMLPKDGYSVDDIFTNDNINLSNRNILDDYDYQKNIVFPELNLKSEINTESFLKYSGIDLDNNMRNLTLFPDYYKLSNIYDVAKINITAEGIKINLKESNYSPKEVSMPGSRVLIDQPFGFLITTNDSKTSKIEDREDKILFSGIVNKL
ncbi:MAG: hypothetical protein K5892_07205 [Acholeplasmatales bacterium]|nr:hypothetical protein [Acholeplasmatales bacterium]